MKRHSWLSWLFPLVALLLPGQAGAVPIAPFPGLGPLIAKADAVVVARVDAPLEPGTVRPNGFTPQRCYLYQVFKGALRVGDAVPLLLRQDGGVSPFAPGSAHLLFLTRIDPPDRCGARYVLAHHEGAMARLAAVGSEKRPEGKTSEQKIKSILLRAKKGIEEERRREDALLRKLLTGH